MGYLIFFGVMAIVAVAMGLYRAVRWIVAWNFTPKTHRRLGSYSESKGAKELAAEGFGITPIWSSTAISRLPKS